MAAIYHAKIQEPLVGKHAVVIVYHHLPVKFVKNASYNNVRKVRFKTQTRAVVCAHPPSNAKIMGFWTMILANAHVRIHGVENNAINVHRNHAMVMAYGIISNVHAYAMRDGYQIRNVKRVGTWNVESMVRLLKKIARVNAKAIGKVFNAMNALQRRSVSLLVLIVVCMHLMRKSASVRPNASRWIASMAAFKIREHVTVSVIQTGMVRLQEIPAMLSC